MDGPPFPSNGLHCTSAAQTCLPPNAIPPNQLPTRSPLSQTLPPLQPPSGNTPYTPRRPSTSQPVSRSGVHSLTQKPYSPNQGYGASAPIAQLGVSSPYGSGSLMQPNPVRHDEDWPTRVVGSQGRRGTLPSAPGRPLAPTAGAGAKSTVTPIKDAEGKFPCPHCTKSYLHAKHLKRHLLRHTGDRPYRCVLCHDTFSRSDILKRHFQKCSVRRGNPTRVSHLCHPHAYVKKHAQAQKADGLGNDGDIDHLNGLNNMPSDGVAHPFGMAPIPLA